MTILDETIRPVEMTEPPVIGDALYDETMTVDGMETGGLYWEGSDRAHWYLAGTNAPGRVWLKAAREASSVAPWFSDDAWAVPPSCAPVPDQSVADMVQDIFGDLGLPTSTLTLERLYELADAQTPEEAAESLAVADAAMADLNRITLDDVAGLFGPDWTGGMDSVSWVRAQRDDDPAQWTAPIPIDTPEEP